MPTVKASVTLTFYVTCPHCTHRDKHEAVMSSLGDLLDARFKDIVGSVDLGTTNIPAKCDNCLQEFTIDRFGL